MRIFILFAVLAAMAIGQDFPPPSTTTASGATTITVDNNVVDKINSGTGIDTTCTPGVAPNRICVFSINSNVVTLAAYSGSVPTAGDCTVASSAIATANDKLFWCSSSGWREVGSGGGGGGVGVASLFSNSISGVNNSPPDAGTSVTRYVNSENVEIVVSGSGGNANKMTYRCIPMGAGKTYRISADIAANAMVGLAAEPVAGIAGYFLRSSNTETRPTIFNLDGTIGQFNGNPLSVNGVAREYTAVIGNIAPTLSGTGLQAQTGGNLVNLCIGGSNENSVFKFRILEQ